MKKVLLIVLPILLLSGGFVGLAFLGIIKVPGLTPKKKKPPIVYGGGVDKKEPGVVAKKEPTPKPAEVKKPVAKVVEEVKTDPVKGAKKLAQLWNSVPTPKLVELTKSFKDAELANILVNMDPEKVAELLAILDAKRSATLSKELQKVASVVAKAAAS